MSKTEHMKITDLVKDQKLYGQCYLCRDKQSLVNRNGQEYLKLLLEDSSSSINGMVWDISKAVEGSFESGDVVTLDAVINEYSGNLQMNVQHIRKSDPSEYVLSQMMRTSREPQEELYHKILDFIDQIKDPGLKALTAHFLTGSSRTAQVFQTNPAAAKMHHAYRNGLLEHTVSVTAFAAGICERYPEMDRDLVISGALLHDIGKTLEIEAYPSNTYTDAGRLVGHIVMGYQMINKAAAGIENLDREKLLRLEHIILSHHGEREYGSPVTPMTMEAMAVHLADDADAKMKQVSETIQYDNTDGRWTAYSTRLESYIYKPQSSGEETADES